MKKALIIYHSKTGITKKFSEEIGIFCSRNNLDTSIMSTEEFTNDALTDVDYLFLGCWTHGMMLLFQHPAKVWVEFANALPELSNKKIVLFTTYKILTGSMFTKMKKYIRCQAGDIILELKSRNGNLIEPNTTLLKNIFSN